MMALSPRHRLASHAGRSPWAWAGAGVVLGLLVSLVLFAPARWLSGVVRQASGGQLLLEQTRGTLWRGSARLTLAGGSGSLDSATLPGRLNWVVRPGVANGAWGLGLQLSADCCLPQPWQWQLSPVWGGLRIAFSDSQSQWPAQLLTGLGTPWNTVQARGLLGLNTQAFALTWVAGRSQVAGRLLLDAQYLSSRLTTLRPMGSYRLALNGGATPELLLSTVSGSLQLSGRGQWVGGKLRFVGEASAAEESLAALSNLLNIIGRRDGARSIIKVG